MAGYNPYNDVQEIVNQKGMYQNYQNQPEREQYSVKAQSYYDNLRNNGYGSLADELNGADLPTAQEILKRYKGDTASASQETIDKLTNVPDYSGQSMTESLDPYQENINGLLTPTYTDTGANANANAKDMLSYMNGLTQPSQSTTQSNSQALANLNAMYQTFGIHDAETTARGNDLWGQMSDYGKAQTGRYDDLYGYIKNTDYYSTPEGKSILQNYNLKGYDASLGANANAAASNGGNIDSYSAANANRQQLAFTNEGMNAALNQKNSNVGNMLSTLQSLGADTGDLQNRMLGMYQGDQNYNLGLAGAYNEGQSNVANQIQNQTNSNNDLYKSGLDYLLGVNTNDTSRYNNDRTVAGNTATGVMNTALGYDDNATSRYNNDKSVAGNVSNNIYTENATTTRNQANNELTRYQMQLSDAYSRWYTDRSVENEQALARIEGDYQIKVQELANEGIITQAEAEKIIAGINANADVGVAGINASADRYVSDNNKLMSDNELAAYLNTADNVEEETMSLADRRKYIRASFPSAFEEGKHNYENAEKILCELYPEDANWIKGFIKLEKEKAADKQKYAAAPNGSDPLAIFLK